MSSPDPLVRPLPSGADTVRQLLRRLAASLCGASASGGGATRRLSERLEAVACIVAIVLAAMQVWATADLPSTIDIVSYLDIGDAWTHARWAEALNGCWNPLYSWILGPVMAVVRPSPRFEYQTVKAVNFAIFLFALLSFRSFLSAVRRQAATTASHEGQGRASIPDWAWVAGGYTLLIWLAVAWITLSSDTPDMLSAALAFLAWGMVLRLDERGLSEGWSPYVRLGVVLALAYFSRTPMLPVGAVLLAALAWQRRQHWRRFALSALVMGALTLPMVVAVSVHRGHFTVGDNGKLNHAWMANPRPNVIPNRYWQGGPPGYGRPDHPVRVLWEEPRAYEFSAPIGGTYPPWTDPSFWYSGLTYHFDADAELATMRSNARFYYQMFGKWLLVALAGTLLVAGDLPRTLTALWKNLHLWAPALAGLAMYFVAAELATQRMMLLQPPTRYIATFVVLLVVGVAASIRLRRVRWPSVVTAVGSAVLVLVCLGLVASLTAHCWSRLRRPSPTAPWRIARALEEAGVRRGSLVAVVGRPDAHEYWARLQRVRIIADTPEAGAFWAAPPDVREAILRRFAGVGAQTVVSSWVGPEAEAAGWIPAAGTTFAARVAQR